MIPADLRTAAAEWETDLAALADLAQTADGLREDNARLAVALTETKQGYNSSLVDWDRPALTGTVTQHGLVVENQRVHGKVSVQAEDVVFRNVACEGRLLPASGGAAVVDAASTKAKRFTIIDSIVTVPTPNARWSQGVLLGPDGVAVRTVCTGSVDGWGWVNKAGGTVQPVMIDCGAHSLTWFPVDPVNTSHTDGTHNDAIQSASPIGAAVVIGGRYDAGPKGTAAFLANVSSVNGLTVCHAILEGGRSGFNFGPTPVVVAVLNYNQIGSPVAYYCKPTTLTPKGNTRPDGTPANTVTKS